MNPAIQALRNNPKAVLTKNVTLPVEDLESLSHKWKVEGKPSKLAGSFAVIQDLEEEHIRHFKNAPYMFRPMSGVLFGGMLVDDKLDYIHIVIVSEEVLDYILNLGKAPEISDEDESSEDLGLSSCEQCGEMAWDGYICHSCGAKHI